MVECCSLAKDKLIKWLKNYSFIDLRSAEANINWESAPKININK